MPFPVLAAIGAGTSLLNNFLNNKSTKKANEANMAFQREMYERQRSDALADWQKEADYNAPRQQMARLQDAGLNPNLVYGHGADATMSSVRSSSPGGYTAQAPRWDLDTGLSSMYDLKLKEAQTDNVKAATEVARLEALNKIVQGDTMKFDLGLKDQLKSITMEMALATLHKAQSEADSANVDASIKGDKKVYEAEVKRRISESIDAANKAELSEQQKQIMKKNLDLLEKEGKLKDFEIKLNELGVSKGDKIPYRILALLLGKFGLKL